MAGILSYFLPKDKVFYSLFEQASDNLEAIAKKLVQVVQEPDFNKRAAHISEMQDIEHQNDNVTHHIFIELGKSFITPFDFPFIVYLNNSGFSPKPCPLCFPRCS